MARRTHPKKPANLRSWRVMRSKGEHIGAVEAPDRDRAETVAVKQFALDQDQRRRLLIRERDRIKRYLSESGRVQMDADSRRYAY